MTAVAAWRASPQQKEAALSAFEAAEIVSALHRSALDGDRTLGALCEIATGRQTQPRPRGRRTLDAELAHLDAAVRAGTLLFLKGWGLDAKNRTALPPGADRERPEEKLVRQAMGNTVVLLFEDRRYRLIPARLWSEARQGRFRIVGIAEARSVVARLSQRPTNTTEQKASWGEIGKQLSERKHGNGLLLLREVQADGSSAARGSEPAITPSQMKPKVQEMDWIEVQVFFSDGTVFGGKCSIELPGGRKVVGAPDKGGLVRLDSVDPGQCNVTFPDLDSAMWDLA